MNSNFVSELQSGIDALKAAGTYKKLNHLDSPQSARVQMEGRGEVLILSSNNYLGLCDIVLQQQWWAAGRYMFEAGYFSALEPLSI